MVKDNVVVDDIQYIDIVDSASTSSTYIGEALPGASASLPVWRIRRVTDVSSVVEITYIDGNSNLDNIWNNRHVSTYS